MKNKILSLLLLMVLVVAGCREEKEEVIKIGAILPLTGDAAQWGIPARNGAMLATEEINKNGGVNGKDVILEIEDDQCDGKNGISAFNKIINTSKPNVILGAVCSSVTLAVAPAAEKNKIVLISPASTNPNITNAGDYIFRTIPTDNLRGKVFAEYVYSTYKRNGAIVYINNDGGKGNEESFRKHFENAGGKIVLSQAYSENAGEIKSLLEKVKNTQPDFLMVVAYPDDALIVLQKCKELNISLPLYFQTEVFDDQNLLKNAGSTAEGVIYISYAKPEGVQVDAFKEAYMNKYGKEPELFAAESYDAIHIVAEILKANPNADATLIKEKLYHVRNYKGASGNITFDEHGDVVKPLAIKKVENSSVLIIHSND